MTTDRHEHRRRVRRRLESIERRLRDVWADLGALRAEFDGIDAEATGQELLPFDEAVDVETGPPPLVPLPGQVALPFVEPSEPNVDNHIARVARTTAADLDAARERKRERDRRYRAKRADARVAGLVDRSEAPTDDHAAVVAEVARLDAEADAPPVIDRDLEAVLAAESDAEADGLTPEALEDIGRGIAAAKAKNAALDAKADAVIVTRNATIRATEPPVLDRLVDHAAGRVTQAAEPAPDLDGELRDAASVRLAGVESRWPMFRREGATNDDLRAELCRHWPRTREWRHGREGSAGYTIQNNGGTPTLWVGRFEGLGHAPALVGVELVRAVRAALKIPIPKAASKPAKKRKEAASGRP